MIGFCGLRAGAQDTSDTGADLDEPASVESHDSTALKVIRPSVSPVVSVAERTESAPALIPAKMPATSPTVKTDISSQAAPAKSRHTVDPVINMGKVETVTDRYPNGKVKLEREVGFDAKGNYVNQGSYKQFDLDGQVSKAGDFLNGKQNGKWMQRFAKNDGYLFSPGQDGEFQGPFASEATFLDGQLHGIWTIKDGNGQNIVEWSFERGVRNGIWTWWHPNGNKRLEATYTSGTLNGHVQEWDRDGKLISQDTYVDGKRLVKIVGWYTLGQKHFEGYYLRSENMPEPTYDWWNSRVNGGRRQRPAAAGCLDFVVSQRQQGNRGPIRPRYPRRQVQVVL
jgi:antitoxin component YwqK of YwqJK toxin-antitoxin module